MLARAGRLTSLQATMWERLDAFLILVAHLGILCLVLASLSGIWDRKGLDEAIAGLLQRPRAWVGQFGESREWLGQLVGAWGRKFMMRRI
ncbi:amino acid permease-like protein [Apiospora arundinis]